MVNIYSKYYDIAISWFTVAAFVAGIWLEFDSLGIALIGGSGLSCLNMFADWITGIFEIMHSKEDVDAETTEA